MAGEASADLHGSRLVQAVLSKAPGVSFFGVGGPLMARSGVELLFRSADLAVVGLTEVLGRLRTIARALQCLKRCLKDRRPDLLLLLDFPDFNLRLARRAHALGLPVLYYISPQVWAWRTGRVRTIRKVVDRMAVILPFEAPFYAHRGVCVEYVGHPLMDAYGDPPPEPSHPAPDSPPLLALLPGSRREEVETLLPAMLEAAERLRGHYPDLFCRLPLAPTIPRAWLEARLLAARVPVAIEEGGLREAVQGASLALVASGTATLETALLGVPMVIAYRVSALSYRVAKRVVHVPFIGLVNLILGRRAIPEVVQDQVNGRVLAEEASRILEDTGVREQMLRDLREVREILGRGGASERTARIALEMMGLFQGPAPQQSP